MLLLATVNVVVGVVMVEAGVVAVVLLVEVVTVAAGSGDGSCW